MSKRGIVAWVVLAVVGVGVLAGYRYQPAPTVSAVTCKRVVGARGTVSVVMSGTTWNRSLAPRTFAITGAFRVAHGRKARFHGQAETDATANADNQPTYVSLGPLFRRHWSVHLNSKVFAPTGARITACTAHVRVGSPDTDND